MHVSVIMKNFLIDTYTIDTNKLLNYIHDNNLHKLLL
jgi:hypothetical protein